MKNDLDIYVTKNLSGKLTKEDKEYIFDYTSSNKDNYISLTMPVRVKNYLNNTLHPIFEMHLPEGYLLSIIKKHFSKIAKTDDFGLLQIMSSNIKARVNYKNQITKNKENLTLDNLLYSKDEGLFDELVSMFALNSSLSGVQPKVLACLEDKATLKLQDYIVKSFGDEYAHLALNEYYSMLIVKNANITTPEFYISDDHKLFIMKRFDVNEDGTYLGFEDMCVLQVKQRDDKYEGSYEAIVKTIKSFVSPIHKKESLKQFFKMVVLNNIIKNGDGHLKNYGLIYENISDIKLAPAYDVVCTTMYIKNDIPALHLLGSKKWWSKKFLIRFGIESCDLTKKEINELLAECEKSIENILSSIKKDMLGFTKEEKVFLEGFMEKISLSC